MPGADPEDPAQNWRLEIATRDAALQTPQALRDRVLYADVATLVSIHDHIGPEGWRTLLAILRHYTVVESRSGGRRLGVIGWGVTWVQQHTQLGNRPARRAVNGLERAGLVIRDELPQTTGAAGIKIGLLDLTRILPGGDNTDLPPITPTGRRWAAGRGTSTRTEGPETITSRPESAPSPTRASANSSTRASAQTSNRSATASPPVRTVLANSSTRSSTALSRIDTEIRELLSIDGARGLLANGLRPALQSDPQLVVDRLVHALYTPASESHARHLLNLLDVAADSQPSSVRYLADAILIDTYLANPHNAVDWFTGWGANLGRCKLTPGQLAERLVVATVATLGRLQPLTQPGGWFRAWCRPYPTSLYSNSAIRALIALATSFVHSGHPKHNRHSSSLAASSRSFDETGPTQHQPGLNRPADEPIRQLPPAVVRQLWRDVVAEHPAAAAWSDRQDSRVAQGFLSAFASEHPEIVDRAVRSSFDPADNAASDTTAH